jgi:hypothetical protein
LLREVSLISSIIDFVNSYFVMAVSPFVSTDLRIGYLFRLRCLW